MFVSFSSLFFTLSRTNHFLDGPTAYQQIPSMAAGPTIVQSRTVQVGHHAVHCICPRCHQQIVTLVNYVCIDETEIICKCSFSVQESGSFAWLMCLLLTVVG
jgi:hypothetical protein